MTKPVIEPPPPSLGRVGMGGDSPPPELASSPHPGTREGEPENHAANLRITALEALSLGLRDYVPVWKAMQRRVQTRDAERTDQLWLTEHPPVYTLGLNGKREHLLRPDPIPVIQCDRGGQVTYHGPGQLVVYLLLDLKRRNLGVRPLVDAIEGALLAFLGKLGLTGETRPKAPGIYVQGAKIASLGLRVREGMSYHGLSLNVNLDLEPFSRINPCGYAGLPMTRLKDLGVQLTCAEAGPLLAEELRRTLGYDSLMWVDAPQGEIT